MTTDNDTPGTPLRVAVLTLGCRVNWADSVALSEGLRAQGFRVVGEAEVADVVVVNTCTVTHRADADARALVRRVQRTLRDAKLVVTGCLAETDPAAVAALPGVYLAVTNRDKERLPAMLRTRLGDVDLATHPVAPDNLLIVPADRARPFVKIQDGCDGTCTYCIVPRARGRSRSRPPAEVVATVRALAARGAGEVVLTGIHIGRYGHDLTPATDLAALLTAVLCETPVQRVRLSSVEPDEVTPALLAAIAPARVCPHFHLPLQSGDDETLRRMGRRYDTATYAATVQALVASRPNMALGADVIVGFPGEDDAAFERTRTFLLSLPFTYLHVFAFSPREGTAAARFGNRPPSPVVRERSAVLRRASDERRAAHHAGLAGTTAGAIIESCCGSETRGLTEHFVPVVWSAKPPCRAGQIVPVTLGRAVGRFVRAVPIRAPQSEAPGPNER